MPVFDFKNASNSSTFECTYTTFNSDNNKATKEHPILVLDNEQRKWENNSVGMFANPYKKQHLNSRWRCEYIKQYTQVDARFTVTYQMAW